MRCPHFLGFACSLRNSFISSITNLSSCFFVSQSVQPWVAAALPWTCMCSHNSCNANAQHKEWHIQLLLAQITHLQLPNRAAAAAGKLHSSLRASRCRFSLALGCVIIHKLLLRLWWSASLLAALGGVRCALLVAATNKQALSSHKSL